MQYYELNWLEEGHVLLAKMQTTIPESEFEAMDQDFLDHFAQSKSNFVHTIFDMTENVDMPDLKRMVDFEFVKSPKLGWTLVAGQLNPVTKFLIVMSAKINRTRFRAFETVEEAVDFIYTVDSSLPARTPAE